MIHAVTETDILTITGAGVIVTEDNRIYDYYQSPASSDLIATPVPKSQIRLLFKFINQMDKSVQYAYNKGGDGNIFDRYTALQFDYEATLNSNSVFNGDTSFKIAGTYIYEVYEVAWNGTVSLTAATAPATERDVLEPADTAGVVMGLCTKGIMMVSDKDGTAQVQYTQHEETSGTNYIYYGQ
jgi:hypothetical protein